MYFYAPASPNSGCHLHRLVYPFRWLSKDFPQHRWETAISSPYNRDFDAIFSYGAQPVANAPEFGTVKRKGAKLVYNIDDSYWEFPEWRDDKPDADRLGMVNLLCELSDHIICSTPHLRDEIARPHKTTVAPNLIDVAHYQLPTPPADDQRIRILYSGATAHKKDLDIIDESCLRLMEKFGPDRIEFLFIGSGPDLTLRDYWGCGAEFIDWVPLSQYHYHIHQTKPHIVLAPLVDCTFNRSKSNIRVLEGWACNAAVVASPVGEYRAILDGINGLLADDGDWFECLCRLVEDRSLREQLAVAGHETVKSEWNWRNPDSRVKWRPSVEAVERLWW
jgi:glycosyltransferase involved in cell wall biosynthesis